VSTCMGVAGATAGWGSAGSGTGSVATVGWRSSISMGAGEGTAAPTGDSRAEGLVGPPSFNVDESGTRGTEDDMWA
jgi:hypothetical protein